MLVHLALAVVDKNSGTCFFSGHGAHVSLIPASAADKKSPPCKFTLRAVSGSIIHTYGERCMDLNLGLHRAFTHIFIVADVDSAIIGTDFLQVFDLVVDITAQCLRDSESHLTACGVVSASYYV